MGTVTAGQSDAVVFRFDQSGALLRKVMESAAVGMTLVGIDGRMIYVNRAYETMLGYAPDICLGLDIDQMLFEDDRQAVQLRFAQMMRGEIEEFRLETRMRHSDGHAIWALASVSMLRSDTTGRPLYSIVQLLNIDRQKRAEEALARSETRLNFALEAARQGVWDHDIRTDGMYYSRMWREMRGIAEDEYVPPDRATWLQRVHPDDVPHILAAIARMDAGEDGYDTMQYRERHRDGRWIWILSRGRPVEWDENGVPTRTVGTDSDITRQKEAEYQLANEKERLRVTLESIGDGVISTDGDGHVTYMNPVAEQLTGWPEQEAIGQPLWNVWITKDESTGEPAADVMGRCLATGAAVEVDADVILVSRKGTGCGVSGIATPVRTEDGSIIGAVVVFKDATDHQEQQRRLSHSANHDALTRLPNRSAFSHALTEACREAGEGQRQHVLCFLDLDHFKSVNDGAGHAAGDALLQKVAQVIRTSCRMQDFAARLGGDEFVLLLADCPIANARVVCEKLAASIAGIDFTWNGAHYHVGASIGIAPVLPGSERDVLAMADAACYSAKAAGRGRVVVSGD